LLSADGTDGKFLDPELPARRKNGPEEEGKRERKREREREREDTIAQNAGAPPGHSTTIGIDCAACALKETSSLLDKQTYPSDLLKSEGAPSSPPERG